MADKTTITDSGESVETPETPVAVTPAVDAPDITPKEPVIVNDEIHHAPLDADGNPIIDKVDEDDADKDAPEPAPAALIPDFEDKPHEIPEPTEAVKNAVVNPNGLGVEYPR